MAQYKTFFVAPFTFTAKFTDTSDSGGSILDLEAEHHKNYYSWSVAMTNDFSSSLTGGLVNKLNPKLIFDILSEYCEQKLDPNRIVIIFPTEPENNYNPITLKFEFKTLVYKSTISDYINIDLTYKQISSEERNDKKIIANNLLLEQKMTDMENRLNAKIDEMTKLIESARVNLVDVLDSGIETISNQ